jgi:hypothetical protein
MDLRDRAVDAPARAHFAPVEDIALLGWTEFHEVLSLISVITEIKDHSLIKVKFL